MSEIQQNGSLVNVEQELNQQQIPLQSTGQIKGQNETQSNNPDQSAKNISNSHNQNEKWQKIISQQTQDESTPFILKQQSFKSQNPPEELYRQKSMMQSTAQNGRQLLIKKQYQSAAKQLSKTLMAFQFIAKNHAQTIQKQILKEMMIQTVLPAYNNLALCYLKLKNFDLVVSFTNQILAQDDSNVKARYRRALAFKQLKNTDHAIKDFQIVKKLDSEMVNDCEEKIKQCKMLEVELRKKRKLSAKKFISGYQSDDIKTQVTQGSNLKELGKQEESQKKKKISQKRFDLLGWIKEKCQKCSKIITNLRPQSKQQIHKE